MAIKKLAIRLKNPDKAGARGTKAADEMMDLLRDNWDQVQAKFNDLNESEKNEMLEHFNSQFENLGDALFGSDAGVDELNNYVDGLDDDKKEDFCTCVDEALQIEQ